MSLEQLLAENTAALLTNNELLRQVLAADGQKTDAGDGADKPKTARGGKKTEKAESGEGTGKTDSAAKGAVTFQALSDDLGKWLGEFSKESDKDDPDNVHPEVVARRSALKVTFEKLGMKKLGDIKEDQAKIEKLWNWLHNKAKPADKGFGIGRLAADPVAANPVEDDDSSDDEDLDV